MQPSSVARFGPTGAPQRSQASRIKGSKSPRQDGQNLGVVSDGISWAQNRQAGGYTKSNPARQKSTTPRLIRVETVSQDRVRSFARIFEPFGIRQRPLECSDLSELSFSFDELAGETAIFTRPHRWKSKAVTSHRTPKNLASLTFNEPAGGCFGRPGRGRGNR